MIRWKKWYYEPDIFGNPLAQGGCLNVEGQAVFDKIAKMPQGKPITSHELDIHFAEFVTKSPTPEEMAMAVNVGPIFWAAWMGYHIVYSRDDYEIGEGN